MKHCTQCKKPLTEFEILFHENAHSNENMSGLCFHCSGAAKTFGEKNNYSQKIKVCLVGLLAIIITFFVALALEEINRNLALTIGVTIILISGFFPTITVLLNRSDTSDPPEQQYSSHYYSGNTYFSSTIETDGSITTKTIDTSGYSTTDNWKGHKHPLLMLILGFYMTVTFMFWCIPYIIYACYNNTGNRKLNIPPVLKNAYKKTCSTYNKVSISRNQKISFLKIRALQNKKKIQQDPFISQYVTPASTNPEILPCKIVSVNKIPHMIVDYNHFYSGHHVCFLLVRSPSGKITMKMSIGDSYIYACEDNWKEDWDTLGADPQITKNIEQYKQIFEKALKRFG